jgi:hypothetical protein
MVLILLEKASGQNLTVKNTTKTPRVLNKDRV